MAAPLKKQKQKTRGRLASWWKSASVFERITILTAIVGGLTGSVIGISQAYPIIEPYWYVARHELRLVMDRQAVATDRQTLFQLQEYLTRAEKDPAVRTSPVVQQRIKDLKKQIDETEDRLKKSSGTK